MATKESTPLIYGKMADVMAAVEVIGKGRNNAAQGFKFRGIDDAYNALHAPLAKHRVFFAATVLDQKHSIGTTKSGGAQYHTHVTVRYTFYAEDGSNVSFETVGEALDTGDKAAGKAQSYALKVALLQVFCIPTEEQALEPDYQAEERALPSLPAGVTTANNIPAPPITNETTNALLALAERLNGDEEAKLRDWLSGGKATEKGGQDLLTKTRERLAIAA